MSDFFAKLPQNNGKSPGMLLTTRDVARIFSVHPNTIGRWCKQGKIKIYCTGPRHAFMFKREDIAIAYLDRSIRHCLENL